MNTCFIGKLMGIGMGFLLLLVPTGESMGAAQANKLPVEISTQLAGMHEVNFHQSIRSKEADKLPMESWVKLEMVVDEEGLVVSATPVSGPAQFYDEAAAIAKKWRYEPFKMKGHITPVKFIGGVVIYPSEKNDPKHVPFPAMRDRGSLIITLERTGCYGSCPSYTVDIHGDGTVIFYGRGNVKETGEHRGQITQEALTSLIEEFRAADYFSLSNGYRAMVTDNPTYKTSISFDGHTKMVSDYVGQMVGMPEAVVQIEKAIDRVAGTDKWVRGKEETGPEHLN